MTATELRAVMNRLGHTQHTLAGALHMGKWGFQSVGKWARGEKPIPPHFAALVSQLIEKGNQP